MRLILGRSYLWLLAAFGVAWASVIVLTARLQLPMKWVVPLLPCFMLFLLLSELRSKVAIDSWWVARHSAKERSYKAIIAWHVLGFLLMTALAVAAWV